MSLIDENLLEAALEILPKQSFKYLKYLGNQINELGVSRPIYADAIELTGSIQIPELSIYQDMGLDLEKNYRNIYVSADIRGNEKQPLPDRFIFSNSVWEVVKNSPWYEFNCWCGVLVVEIKELRNV